jgi:predicted  nucleic acid-binding Zn-ribbon protein
MTDEARKKINRLEEKMRALMAQEKLARLGKRDEEANALVRDINTLSGEIAQAYYASVHS